MLVGLESIVAFSSRMTMLSRKLLGLHLILWMQPIALNSNTVHKNVQQSGGKERRMETSKRSPQLVPHHVSPTERRKKWFTSTKKVFIWSNVSHEKPCILFLLSKTTKEGRPRKSSQQSECFPVRERSFTKTGSGTRNVLIRAQMFSCCQSYKTLPHKVLAFGQSGSIWKGSWHVWAK